MIRFGKSWSLLLLTGLLLFGSNIAEAQTELQEYMARSLAIANLDALNADLSAVVYADRYGALRHDAQFDGEEAKYSLDIYGSSVDKADFSDLSYSQLKALFRDRFKTESILQGPLLFSGLEFSTLSGLSNPYRLSAEGDVAITGRFERAGVATNYAFSADFDVEVKGSEVTCTLASLDIGKSAKQIEVDPKAPWAIHNDIFLDSHISPLLKDGYVDLSTFDEVTGRILSLQSEHKWIEEVSKKQDWNLAMIGKMKRLSAVATASLFEAVPILNTPGAERSRTKTAIVEDTEIGVLLSYFDTEPAELKTAPNTLISESEEWETAHIQAHLLRAWYYVVYDELDTRYFDYDVQDASFYPTNREVHLISFFGHVLQGEHAKAQSDMNAYRSGPFHPVMEHYLKTFYADQWFTFGEEMDRLHDHNKSMEGLFIGAQFGAKESRMKQLAKKAIKMDEDEVANSSLSYVLREKKQAADPSLWLDLAVAKAGMGLDPTSEIAKGEEGIGKESPLSYTARAQYAAKSGNATEANTQLYTGLKKWKKNTDLMSLKADLSNSFSAKKKYLIKAVKQGNDTISTRLFKKGFVSHSLAEQDSSGLAVSKKKDLYKDAIFYYKQGVRRGYDETLGNKKIAEAYVSLNKPEEAAYYFGRAIENQDRSAAVYFAQAVLDFTSNDMTAFTENMDKARSMGILDLANERDKQLFQFLYTLRQINDLSTLTLTGAMTTDEGKKLVNKQTTRVNEEIKSLKNLGQRSERVKVYTDFTKAMYQSIKEYNDRFGEDRKYRKEANVDVTDLIERMTAHSDVELYFFKNNSMVKNVSRWNDIYKSMVKEMPKAKKRSPIQYLQDADVFKDSYNYL